MSLSLSFSHPTCIINRSFEKLESETNLTCRRRMKKSLFRSLVPSERAAHTHTHTHTHTHIHPVYRHGARALSCSPANNRVKGLIGFPSSLLWIPRERHTSPLSVLSRVARIIHSETGSAPAGRVSFSVP